MKCRVRIVFSQQRFVVFVFVDGRAVGGKAPSGHLGAVHARIGRQRIGMVGVVKKIHVAQRRGHFRPRHFVGHVIASKVDAIVVIAIVFRSFARGYL